MKNTKNIIREHKKRLRILRIIGILLIIIAIIITFKLGIISISFN